MEEIEIFMFLEARQGGDFFEDVARRVGMKEIDIHMLKEALEEANP